MKTILLLIFSLFFVATASADIYKLDSSHSRMGFKIKHLGISTVTGQFNKFQGHGKWEGDRYRLSEINVTIDSASIDTNEKDRDKHLRSRDFFNVEKFPSLTFVSSNIIYEKGIPTAIRGKLTMLGHSKNITLDVDWGGVVKDPWGNIRMAFQASGKIDRRHWGLSWNKPLAKVKSLLIGNEVKLIIDVEAIKSQDKKKQ